MWQSDILTFRLAGKNAYLIGYLDDYSRYITGLGFCRSQTAENVIETYRLAGLGQKMAGEEPDDRHPETGGSVTPFFLEKLS